MSHEVEDGDKLLSFGFTKSSSKLLQKDGKTLCGAKEENGVNFRYINAFIEHIDDKEEIDFLLFQISAPFSTFRGIIAYQIA